MNYHVTESAGRRLAVLALAVLLAACASKNPNERETGNGGRMLRVSSRQVTIDLSEQEQQALAKVQDRRLRQVSGRDATRTSAAVLGKLGFEPVRTDLELLQVEGERNKIVGDRWRAAIRALIKAKGIPLRGKPDHESVRAQITVRPNADATLVRARFDVTVWDTNGDSRTTTVSDGAIYDCFFGRLDKALTGRPEGEEPACEAPDVSSAVKVGRDRPSQPASTDGPASR